jgi:arylsulfatase A-like enzyme
MTGRSAVRPNLLFVMSDDHAAHAISSYSAASVRPVVNQTPNLDRIATDGMRFDSCFCTNSICTPSRAAVLTGTYNQDSTAGGCCRDGVTTTTP